jgi:hypothetical protein
MLSRMMSDEKGAVETRKVLAKGENATPDTFEIACS